MGEITRLLDESRAGRVEARSELFNRVYAELMQLARSRLVQAAPMTQLDAPSLVHEAYLRLANRTELPGRDRRAFFAYASNVMRTVIVDYLRERGALKRGGDQVRITLATHDVPAAFDVSALERLEGALQELTAIDARAAQVVELRYFGGLSNEDIAQSLEISLATVKRCWQKARAFLYHALQSES